VTVQFLLPVTMSGVFYNRSKSKPKIGRDSSGSSCDASPKRERRTSVFQKVKAKMEAISPRERNEKINCSSPKGLRRTGEDDTGKVLNSHSEEEEEEEEEKGEKPSSRSELPRLNKDKGQQEEQEEQEEQESTNESLSDSEEMQPFCSSSSRRPHLKLLLPPQPRPVGTYIFLVK